MTMAASKTPPPIQSTVTSGRSGVPLSSACDGPAVSTAVGAGVGVAVGSSATGWQLGGVAAPSVRGASGAGAQVKPKLPLAG